MSDIPAFTPENKEKCAAFETNEWPILGILGTRVPPLGGSQRHRSRLRGKHGATDRAKRAKRANHGDHADVRGWQLVYVPLSMRPAHSASATAGCPGTYHEQCRATCAECHPNNRPITDTRHVYHILQANGPIVPRCERVSWQGRSIQAMRAGLGPAMHIVEHRPDLLHAAHERSSHVAVLLIDPVPCQLRIYNDHYDRCRWVRNHARVKLSMKVGCAERAAHESC